MKTLVELLESFEDDGGFAVGDRVTVDADALLMDQDEAYPPELVNRWLRGHEGVILFRSPAGDWMVEFSYAVGGQFLPVPAKYLRKADQDEC